MLITKRSMACLGVLGLLVLSGCADGPIDNADSAHVVLQIETLDTPGVTGAVEGDGVCSGDAQVSCTSDATCANAQPALGSCIGLTCTRVIAEWSGTARNVPKNSLANTSPFNDIILQTLDLSYPGSGLPSVTIGLGSITIPADSSGSFEFFPITFQAIEGFPDDTAASVDVLFTIHGTTPVDDAVSVTGAAQLNIEKCFNTGP